MTIEPPTPAQRQVVEAVENALASWPGAGGRIRFEASGADGYRLSVETIPGYREIKLAANPTTARRAAIVLRDLATQATVAADAIEAATGTSA